MEVPRDDYFFRTAIRLTTGAPDWLHLNRVMAVASAAREVNRVVLHVYRLA